MLMVENTMMNKTWREINRLLLRAMREARVMGGGNSKRGKVKTKFKITHLECLL